MVFPRFVRCTLFSSGDRDYSYLIPVCNLHSNRFTSKRLDSSPAWTLVGVESLVLTTHVPFRNISAWSSVADFLSEMDV